MKTTLVSGLVRVGAESDAAAQRIMALGYEREGVSVVMSHQTRKRHFALAGAGLGTAEGAAVAAILLVGATFLLPGIGLVVAGPLATALMGVDAGRAKGGACGVLIGAGIPEHHARIYEAGLATGLIVIGVHARSIEDTERVEEILRELAAAEVPSVTPAPITRLVAA